MHSFSQGSLLGEQYRLGPRIAVGGQGAVHAATRTDSDAPLAIKVLHAHLAEDPRHVAALMDEAELALHVDHPNVCRVLELGRAEGVPFLVMERLDGVSFGRLDDLRTERLEQGHDESWRLALTSVIHDAARGLHAAHTATTASGDTLGVIHRDVKPSNLVVCSTGTAKVIDFGIGRLITSEAVTATGEVRGTLAYLAPERFAGQSGTAATDVWALGVILFEMALDRPLLPADGFWETFELLSTGHWNTALQLRLPADDPLSPLIAKALRRAPAERFRSAGELADALEATQPPAAWARRHDEVKSRVQEVQSLPPLVPCDLSETVTRVEVPSPTKRSSRLPWVAAAVVLGASALGVGMALGRTPPREEVREPPVVLAVEAPVDEARDALEPAIPGAADHPQASVLRQAVADYYGMRFAAANDALTTLVLHDPTDRDAHYYRALVRAFGFGGRLELPMEPPPEAHWPTHPARRAVIELAVAFEEGRCREAADAARPVAERHPDHFELWFALGECLFHSDQAREGGDAFVRSVELEPRFLPPVVHVQSFLVLQPSELLARASQSWKQSGYQVDYLEIAAANWAGEALPHQPEGGGPHGRAATLLAAWRYVVDGERDRAGTLLEQTTLDESLRPRILATGRAGIAFLAGDREAWGRWMDAEVARWAGAAPTFRRLYAYRASFAASLAGDASRARAAFDAARATGEDAAGTERDCLAAWLLEGALAERCGRYPGLVALARGLGPAATDADVAAAVDSIVDPALFYPSLAMLLRSAQGERKRLLCGRFVRPTVPSETWPYGAGLCGLGGEGAGGVRPGASP